MAHENKDSSVAREVTDLVVPEQLIRGREADRALAFASIEFHAKRLGIDLAAKKPSGEEALYFKLLLDSSRQRKVIVARTFENVGGAMLRAYVNDEAPHPAPELYDVRRMHMTTFVTSIIGKRIVCRRSSADSIIGDDLWYGNGETFDGPYIFHDRELELVELRGSASHTFPQLPPFGVKLPPDQDIHRTEDSLTLAAVLESIEPERDRVDDVTVWLPSHPDGTL